MLKHKLDTTYPINGENPAPSSQKPNQNKRVRFNSPESRPVLAPHPDSPERRNARTQTPATQKNGPVEQLILKINKDFRRGEYKKTVNALEQLISEHMIVDNKEQQRLSIEHILELISLYEIQLSLAILYSPEEDDDHEKLQQNIYALIKHGEFRLIYIRKHAEIEQIYTKCQATLAARRFKRYMSLARQGANNYTDEEAIVLFTNLFNLSSVTDFFSPAEIRHYYTEITQRLKNYKNTHLLKKLQLIAEKHIKQHHDMFSLAQYHLIASTLSTNDSNKINHSLLMLGQLKNQLEYFGSLNAAEYEYYRVDVATQIHHHLRVVEHILAKIDQPTLNVKLDAFKKTLTDDLSFGSILDEQRKLDDWRYISHDKYNEDEWEFFIQSIPQQNFGTLSKENKTFIANIMNDATVDTKYKERISKKNISHNNAPVGLIIYSNYNQTSVLPPRSYNLPSPAKNNFQ